jgi:hypothetical protein
MTSIKGESLLADGLDIQNWHWQKHLELLRKVKIQQEQSHSLCDVYA